MKCVCRFGGIAVDDIAQQRLLSFGALLALVVIVAVATKKIILNSKRSRNSDKMRIFLLAVMQIPMWQQSVSDPVIL